MSEHKLIKLFGLDLIGAGIVTALFWLLALPFESFAGPDVPSHALFVPGQWLHVIGAVLAVFGYTGLYLSQREVSGRLGLIGFYIAIIGALFFFADGIIALITFPVLAEHAPALTEAAGPMFLAGCSDFTFCLPRPT